MIDNIIEQIRQLLIKTVLPLRKRKENFLSKFHFSITFRISLNYLKLILLNGVLFFSLFIIFYLSIARYEYKQMGHDIIHELRTIGNEIVIYNNEQSNINLKNQNQDEHTEEERLDLMIRLIQKHKIINPYIEKGVTLRILDRTTKKVIYEDLEHDVSTDKKYLDSIYFNMDSKKDKLILIEDNHFEIKTFSYEIYFQYNLTSVWDNLMVLILGMDVIFLFVVFLIIKRGQKGLIKLIEPIEDMTATANRINVNNIHSERINIEGTKNELKDLATVMNKMLDRIEVSYECQKQFVSDASHELRTPIAVIQGYANLLDRWGKNDKTVMEEAIEAIKNESISMQDLVEKLLFLSRHDKKTLKLTKTKFNMKEIIEDMVKETNLVVTNRLILNPILEDVIVYGDKQALKQGIRVFIDNAIKYTNEGDTITITCENNNGDCIVSVNDTGIGMTRNDVDHIFERFYRSDEVRNQKINGHGLGLSIAKLIILSHTGSIKVRSQFSVGTSFIITLPKRIL